jgi:DNA replication protein DnaC
MTKTGGKPMLNEQTITKMQSIRLSGMAHMFKELMENPKRTDLTHEEFIGLLVDAELTARENRKLQRLLNNAHLKQHACIEDIDYTSHRGLNKQVILELSDCNWLKHHQNVLISGPTGVGKTYIVCSLGDAACRNGYSVSYIRAPKLFTAMLQARADGSYLKVLSKLSKFGLLIIDDIGQPMNDIDRKDLLEVIEERYMDSATIVASQVPIKDWYQVIGEPTIADAICDRLMHNAYKIELKGESLRKKNNLK